MLILSLRMNEAFVIDGDIRVRLLSSPGDRACFEIEAPARFGIDQEECFRRDEFCAEESLELTRLTAFTHPSAGLVH